MSAPERQKVLVLGGTSEAAALAQALHMADIDVTTSLAGRTTNPRAVAGAVRIGGFGGVEGLAGYLMSEGITALIDATHPFAEVISNNAFRAAEATGVARLQLQRPAWHPQPGDNWSSFKSMAAAAASLPTGAQVFLTVGRQELGHFAKREDVVFVVRLIDPPEHPLPLPRHGVILGRGPFDRNAEEKLLRSQGIDLIVSKNSGGEGARAKLDAARALGLPVVLIERPPTPPGSQASTIDQALDWLRLLRA